MGKIYIAGKLNNAEFGIEQLGNELESRGHEITFRWWDKTLPKLATPYLNTSNLETSRAAGDAMIKAVTEADTAVILFPTPTILGAAVEFGAGLATREQWPERELLVVSEPEDLRQSVFYASTAVIVLESIALIRERNWY